MERLTGDLCYFITKNVDIVNAINFYRATKELYKKLNDRFWINRYYKDFDLQCPGYCSPCEQYRRRYLILRLSLYDLTSKYIKLKGVFIRDLNKYFSLFMDLDFQSVANRKFISFITIKDKSDPSVIYRYIRGDARKMLKIQLNNNNYPKFINYDKKLLGREIITGILFTQHSWFDNSYSFMYTYNSNNTISVDEIHWIHKSLIFFAGLFSFLFFFVI